MDSSEFLRSWFIELPWMVISDICSYLPPEIISDVLLRVPQLRKIIAEQYYTPELHLILSPPKRPHACSGNPQKQKLRDITTYGEIEDFLEANPDIIPQKIKVIASQDFRSLEVLLHKFRSQLSVANSLEIHIEKYELSRIDLELLLSFPNLSKLQTGMIKLRHCAEMFSEDLQHHESLVELVLLAHEVSDWSSVKFPSTLRSLDMSWYLRTDVESVSLPPSLRNLYWNQVGLGDAVLKRLHFPHNISTLMVTYNNLSEINVSQLPRTLETLDLSSNALSSFYYDEESPYWPPSLKSILLTNNAIDNRSAEQLSHIKWPPFLENLRLDGNKFTSLEHFSSLPRYLKYLDLSDSFLQSLGVKQDGTDNGYPYFRFPESLEHLNLSGCSSLTYDELSQLPVIPVELRIGFPNNVKTLNLTECSVDNLSYFIFPKSIETMSLAGNAVSDLTTYNLTIDSKEIVSWKELTKLQDLELFYNRIDSLENWVIPSSLKKLDLRRNAITKLALSNTPIFNKRFESSTRGLTHINLEQNKIDYIDPHISLPPNLTYLNLSRNFLSTFTFTESFAHHKRLTRLDLSWNQIEQIKVDVQDNSIRSNLKQLDFSRNASENFKMTRDDFYGVFEKLGLQVTKKKHNIKGEHIFM